MLGRKVNSLRRTQVRKLVGSVPRVPRQFFRPSSIFRLLCLPLKCEEFAFLFVLIKTGIRTRDLLLGEDTESSLGVPNFEKLVSRLQTFVGVSPLRWVAPTEKYTSGLQQQGRWSISGL